MKRKRKSEMEVQDHYVGGVQVLHRFKGSQVIVRLVEGEGYEGTPLTRHHKEGRIILHQQPVQVPIPDGEGGVRKDEDGNTITKTVLSRWVADIGVK